MGGPSWCSAMPVGDPTAVQVVRAQLDLDLVARKDADVVLAHLPGDGREDGMSSLELHPEHRARERLDDLALNLDLLFLGRHFLSVESLQKGLLRARQSRCTAVDHRSKAAPAVVRIRGRSAGIATVCSKWAASDSSTDEIDQSSSWTYTSGPPAVIIGSIANVIPSCRSGPRPGGP